MWKLLVRGYFASTLNAIVLPRLTLMSVANPEIQGAWGAFGVMPQVASGVTPGGFENISFGGATSHSVCGAPFSAFSQAIGLLQTCCSTMATEGSQPATVIPTM